LGLHVAMGRIVLGLAIAGSAVGLASLALYFGLGVISPETSVKLILVSLASSAAAVIIGFVLRRRARLAHEGMFVGLATLGAWFLLLVYAFSQT
jgi:hypothetical protein